MDWDNIRNVEFGMVYRLCDSCGFNPATKKDWCEDCGVTHHVCVTCFIIYSGNKNDFDIDEYNPDMIEEMR